MPIGCRLLRVFDWAPGKLCNERKPKSHIHQPAVDRALVAGERVRMVGRSVVRLGEGRQLFRTPDTGGVALRLEPAGWRDRSLLFGLYARSMGSLWFRLFPGLRPRRFLPLRVAGFRVMLLAMARDAERSGVPAEAGRGPLGPSGLVVWERESLTFFADPAACDAALLARVALQLTALGARREATLELRGLPRTFLARPGPIALQVLMGMPDPPTQWKK